MIEIFVSANDFFKNIVVCSVYVYYYYPVKSTITNKHLLGSFNSAIVQKPIAPIKFLKITLNANENFPKNIKFLIIYSFRHKLAIQVHVDISLANRISEKFS